MVCKWQLAVGAAAVLAVSAAIVVPIELTGTGSHRSAIEGHRRSHASATSTTPTSTTGDVVAAVVQRCTSTVGCSKTLEQSAVDSSAFETVLSVEARSLGAALAFHTPVGFVALTPRSTTTAHVYATGDVPSASGWNAFPDPCASTGGNYTLGLASMVAPDTTRLFTLCYGPGHAGSETKLLSGTGSRSARELHPNSRPRSQQRRAVTLVPAWRLTPAPPP